MQYSKANDIYLIIRCHAEASRILQKTNDDMFDFNRFTMKRCLSFFLFVIIASTAMMAQDYDNLWKKVEDAKKKDLPKTQIDFLRQIEAKALSEKEYGQLLASQTNRYALEYSIFPDSLEPHIMEMEMHAMAAEKKDLALAAVYYTLLGNLYGMGIPAIDGFDTSADAVKNRQRKKELYFKKAMEHPEVLAAHTTGEYSPIISKGKDSEIFNDDLLHVIGMNTGNWKGLEKYYVETGNRRAACICSSICVKDTVEADSLIKIYEDLPEAGEIAIARYRMMGGCPTSRKIEYIDFSLDKWKDWEHMNELRNSRIALTKPFFNAHIDRNVNTSENTLKVNFTKIRNVRDICVKASRLDVNGDYDTFNKDKRSKILKHVTEEDVCAVTRHYDIIDEHTTFNDSLFLNPLPVGVYLLDFYADNKLIETESELYFVSNVTGVVINLPNNRNRYVVMDARTGNPIQNARIKFVKKIGKTSSTTVTTDNKGEAIVNEETYSNCNVYMSSETDKFSPPFGSYKRWYYYDRTAERYKISLFSDRSIYRPGQNVHVAATIFANTVGDDFTVIANEEVTIVLKNANYDVVSEETVRTNEFGSASTEFSIPKDGLNGNYNITASCGKWQQSCTIKVEEYKRPTFTIEIPKYDKQYSEGDTVRIKGYAKTYSGMPVQGAKVECSVSRRLALWWARWYQNQDDNTILLDNKETVTDAEGVFYIDIPVVLPKDEDNGYGRIAHFYSFEASAKVTDIGGESHIASYSLPFSVKPTVLSCNLPEKALADSLRFVRFNYMNAAGKDIEGRIKFSIGGHNYEDIPANKDFEIKKLKSGKYDYTAVCDNDTITGSIVVFSIKDKKPFAETQDWFYASSEYFNKDSSPVYVQVGASAENQHYVYSVFSGKDEIGNGSFTMSNAIKTFEFAYKPEYNDGITFTCAWVNNGKTYIHSARIKKPMPDKKLGIEWTSFRDRLEPGQEETWTMRITTPEGNPAKALVTATMYDMSLDQLFKHEWTLNLGVSRNIPYAEWCGQSINGLNIYYYAPWKNYVSRDLSFSNINNKYLSFYRLYGDLGMPAMTYVRGKRLSAKAVESVEIELTDMAVASDAVANIVRNEIEDEMIGRKDDTGDYMPRTNLEETAFFYPQMHTDKNGNLEFSFRLPESVTTWRLMAISHDKNMNYGITSKETVASKKVMVQPNMPRFARQGDIANIPARLLNTSEIKYSGKAIIQIMNPEDEKCIWTDSKEFTIEANNSCMVSFDINLNDIINNTDDINLLICRIVAEGNGFRDGEQHYLPILPARETVINTLPITMHDKGSKSYDITKILPKSEYHDAHLTFEYTNNPAWFVVQALPATDNLGYDNAINVATVLYSNCIGRFIANRLPLIKRTLGIWSNEDANTGTLVSNLYKNDDVKNILIEETPWVTEAKNDSERMGKIADFFNTNNMEYKVKTAITKLKELQNHDGSWSWCKGMAGSVYMTNTISTILTRLAKMTGDKALSNNMISKANAYMAKAIRKVVKDMKDAQKRGVKPVIGNLEIDYLYLRAISNDTPSDMEKKDIEWLVGILSQKTSELTLYGKASAAIIMYRFGYVNTARTFLKSALEYSVYTEEMGRYFDSPKAYYSWFDYRIPTEVRMIEAINELMPENNKTIGEMRQWLLQEKRTTSWDTPYNTINAIHAFFFNNSQDSETIDSALEKKENAIFYVDGKPLNTESKNSGLGYVKTIIDNPKANTLKIEKMSDKTSWGALYARLTQDAGEVENKKSGIGVSRSYYLVKGNGESVLVNKGTKLSVGDKIKEKIVITADRDYDFVQIADKRAACMEPVKQISGYNGGIYYSPKDNSTYYYIDILNKGKHIIETEYFIDRNGYYSTGTCSVQCAYAPEFSGVAGGVKIKVGE